MAALSKEEIKKKRATTLYRIMKEQITWAHGQMLDNTLEEMSRGKIHMNFAPETNEMVELATCAMEGQEEKFRQYVNYAFGKREAGKVMPPTNDTIELGNFFKKIVLGGFGDEQDALYAPKIPVNDPLFQKALVRLEELGCGLKQMEESGFIKDGHVDTREIIGAMEKPRAISME